MRHSGPCDGPDRRDFPAYRSRRIAGNLPAQGERTRSECCDWRTTTRRRQVDLTTVGHRRKHESEEMRERRFARAIPPQVELLIQLRVHREAPCSNLRRIRMEQFAEPGLGADVLIGRHGDPPAQSACRGCASRATMTDMKSAIAMTPIPIPNNTVRSPNLSASIPRGNAVKLNPANESMLNDITRPI